MPSRQYQLTHEGYIVLLPDTKIPKAEESQWYLDYLAWVAAGGVPLPPDPLPNDEVIASLKAAVQDHLDQHARQRGYDGILSACSYATSTNPTFSAEASSCVSGRDATWAYCWRVLADVEAGIRATPTAAELIAELPPMTWPA